MEKPVKVFGIEFAPLMIPLNRRLQTLCVALFYFSMLFSMFYIVPVFVYILLCTNYWQIPVICITWIIYDWETPYTGGRKWMAMRNFKVWQYSRDYFPIRLVKTANLPADNNYLFCVYPHGISSAGVFLNFMSNANHFDKLYPGIDPYLVTLNANFRVPLARDLFLASGAVGASAHSMMNILTKGPGSSCVLMPGGASEALLAFPGTYNIIVKKRKGFVKLALKSGASLVPVFSFGENEIFGQVRDSRILWLQEKLRGLWGISPCLIKGRGFFQYTIGLLPYRKPIVTVVGEPIQVSKTENPSDEMINEYHEKYVNSLKSLFEKYKSEYDPLGEKAQLTIE